MISANRKFGLIISLLLLAGNILGQGINMKHQMTVGLSVPALSEGRGFHLAYSPSVNIFKYIELQAQLSYCNTKITSAFLSGAKGWQKSVNILAGPRIYFRSETKMFRPYWFLLVGMNRYVEERNGTLRDPENSFGLTTGFMAEINHFVVGFAAESPGIAVLRFGYLISRNQQH